MAVWTDEAWLAEFRAWATGGLDVTGEIEQPHKPPWSTLLRIPTSDGVVWAKACTPALAHEVAVTQALARWRPGVVPEVLAADTERAWIVIRDAGLPLRIRITTPADLVLWYPVLAEYADTQQVVAPHADELVAMGAPDFHPATLPERYDAVTGEMPEEQQAALHKAAPRLADLCAELVASGVPDSIEHDDLHDNNVFVRPDGHATLADWGDACVTHPFVSLVVLTRSATYRLKIEPDAPEIVALHDAYLAAFGGDRGAVKAAMQVGLVIRGLAWHRLLAGLEEDERPPYADAVPGYLQDFLDALSA